MGVGGSQRLKILKKCMEFNWNFQRGGGGGGSYKNSLPWGRYGYFMELHNHIKLSSSAIRFPDLNYSNKLPLSEIPLSKDKHWSIVAYNQSKLCNLLFSMELNRRLKPKGVTCNAVHPGNLIYTSLSKNSWFYWLFFLMARPFAKTPVSKSFCTM